MHLARSTVLTSVAQVEERALLGEELTALDAHLRTASAAYERAHDRQFVWRPADPRRLPAPVPAATAGADVESTPGPPPPQPPSPRRTPPQQQAAPVVVDEQSAPTGGATSATVEAEAARLFEALRLRLHSTQQFTEPQ
jgi:hypothetical protein